MGETGKLVTFYWTKDRELILEIDGQKMQLSPWVGVQMEEWQANGRNWYRDDLEEHVPNDLLQYLERTGQSKVFVRKTARLK